jgi:transposase-like protein
VQVDFFAMPTRVPGSERMSQAARVNWAAAPVVYVVVATCPSCGSPRYRRSKTTGAGNSDGSRTRRVACESCATNYKIVTELPASGNADESSW